MFCSSVTEGTSCVYKPDRSGKGTNYQTFNLRLASAPRQHINIRGDVDIRETYLSHTPHATRKKR
jgi:hypothetical protein